MSVQVVCCLFCRGVNFEVALTEFKWSIKQNREFWRTAVLYLEPQAAAFVSGKYRGAFKEVVVDYDVPAKVSQEVGWSFKGWWAKKATERFGRILLCDFDIFVQRMPDDELFGKLTKSPMFVDYPNYPSPKVVGCGITYYDMTCEWDRFMELLLNKWHHDEKAWTETLDFTREKFLASGRHMNPFIVDYKWVLDAPEKRYEPYIIHGISPMDSGRLRLRHVGFSDKEMHFAATLKEELIYRAVMLKRRLVN